MRRLPFFSRSTLCFALLPLVAQQACARKGSPGDGARPTGAASQAFVVSEPGVDTKALAVSVTGLAGGAPLFDVTRGFAGSRIVDPADVARAGFPDDVDGFAPASADVAMTVRACDVASAREHPDTCGDDYFPGSDPKLVARAVLDAMLALTLSDRVPACYRDALTATEHFEAATSIASLRAAIDRDVHRFARRHCRAMPRSEWASHAECGGSLLDEQRALEAAFAGVAPEIVSAYSRRYLLGLRLGVDELAALPPARGAAPAAYELSPFPNVTLGEYATRFGCSPEAMNDGVARLGDARCLFNDHLTGALAGGRTDFFYSADGDLGTTTPAASMARVVGAAVRLAKITALAPKPAIAQWDAASGGPIACDDVARYSFGNDTRRSRYVSFAVDPAAATCGGGSVDPAAIALVADGKTSAPAANGGVASFAQDLTLVDASVDALRRAGYDRLRVRVIGAKGASAPSTTLLTARFDLLGTTGAVRLLGAADARALGPSTHAALYLEGHRAACDVVDGWELVTSYRLAVDLRPDLIVDGVAAQAVPLHQPMQPVQVRAVNTPDGPFDVVADYGPDDDVCRGFGVDRDPDDASKRVVHGAIDRLPAKQACTVHLSLVSGGATLASRALSIVVSPAPGEPPITVTNATQTVYAGDTGAPIGVSTWIGRDGSGIDLSLDAPAQPSPCASAFTVRGGMVAAIAPAVAQDLDCDASLTSRKGAWPPVTTPLHLRVHPRGVAPLAAGARHACVIAPDGVRCWGNGRSGQLGNGGLDSSDVGVAVVGLPGAAKSLAAGGAHTCALVDDGRLFCWGDSTAGQLGTGALLPAPQPAAVTAVDDAGGQPLVAKSVVAGNQHTCAIRGDDSVVCWGAGAYGQLGNGRQGGAEREPSPQPVALAGRVKMLAAGAHHTCALVDGAPSSVWCWGRGQSGQLGSGATANAATPVRVSTTEDVASIEAGARHTCAVTKSGDVLCWGEGISGQLGVGSARSVSLPAAVPGFGADTPRLAAGAAHTCAWTDAGLLACWGSDLFGQLGVGDAAPLRAAPVPLAADAFAGAPIRFVAAGERHTCALTTQGAVYCWGDLSYGAPGVTAIQRAPKPISLSSAPPTR